MTKFSRLQWIPMIVKAYNEARERTLPKPTETVHNISSASPPASAPSNLRKQGAKNRRSNAATRSTSAGSRRNHGSHAITDAPSEAAYDRVIQELRDAKSKLNQLETIHQRLELMQARIEQQLNELREQLHPGQPPARNDSTKPNGRTERSARAPDPPLDL
ncbi:hypothetical protein GCM10025857_09630 [Alicyclobacillus contaminans]|uniref:hypothetical protein n=1 Tax=Alicyclobacillus contaminans TaxID=392016 RepID=UPI000413B4E0|nr:hypothetical protein [Alicyclobacillus contaminans]GMA49606.1 hypothetical protein GCM10025857_09630 [Alicyclobacillus contaminans]